MYIVSLYQSIKSTNLKAEKPLDSTCRAARHAKFSTQDVEQTRGGRNSTNLRPVDETLATLGTLVRHPLGIMGNAEQCVRSDLGRGWL